VSEMRLINLLGAVARRIAQAVGDARAFTAKLCDALFGRDDLNPTGRALAGALLAAARLRLPEAILIVNAGGAERLAAVVVMSMEPSLARRAPENEAALDLTRAARA
jgi:hypothetical protein